MTPLQIEILLHYSYGATDFRDGDFSAPAVRSAINVFKDMEGMLEVDHTTGNRAYRLTARGQAFVNHICNLPLPTIKWEMPQ